MKIRSQFRILIAGIVFIPFILFVTMIFVAFYRSPKRVMVHDSSRLEWDNYKNTDATEWKHIKHYIKSLPPFVECMIIGEKGEIVYSSMTEANPGMSLLDDELLQMIRDTSRDYMYQIDVGFQPQPTNRFAVPGTPDEINQMTTPILVTRIPRNIQKGPDIIIQLSSITFFVLGSVLLFAVIISIIIARSFTNSVARLEQEAEKLAGGNLNNEIVVHGNNEITSLANSFEHMRLALKEHMQRKSRLIMGLSHDLRTPIALIKGYSEAIRDGMADDPEAFEKSLDIITTKIDQLESLIESLIEIVRMDASEWKGKLTDCEANTFLSSYASRMSADGNLLHRQVETAVSIPEDITIKADEEMFLRVLDNISGNAFRYTKEGGQVSFSAQYRREKNGKSSVIITVSDNGCGIAAEDMPFIFDPFYRGTNSRREEGYGFGLAAVKHIADTYSWTITVSSEIGRGTSFIITIPLETPSHTTA